MQGCKRQSPISLSASLHAVPQKAPAPYIIDEAFGRWDPALKVFVFVASFYVEISTYLKVNIWLINWRFECIPFPNRMQLLEYSF